MPTTRLEAFSDGVLAIIITIMVLELKVPHSADLDTLRPLLPAFLSYVLSFVYLGIYWNNHHHMMHAVKRVTGGVLWANLHLLFWLSLLPFVTSWVANHHRQSAPVACYGVVLLMCSVSFLLLKRALRHSEAAHPSLAAMLGHGRKNALSILFYAVAIPLSLATPLGATAIYVLLALLWFLPDHHFETVRSQ